MRSLFALSLLGLSATSAFAGLLPLDPGVSLQLFSSGWNDGYNSTRGMWFQANNSITVNGAGFYNGFSADDSFSMDLWEADSTGTNLNITNLGSFTVSNPTAGALYNTGLFSSPVNLVAGNYYYLSVFSNADFDDNYFYDWNGTPSVNLGDVTVLDGGMGSDLGNTVAPAVLLDIETVPEPASMAVLGLGALALMRRRRTSK